MIVTIKISLNEATATKRRRLLAIMSRLRACTQQYIDTLWDERGKLDKATLDRIDFPQLGYDQKATCLRNALQIVITTRKSAKALKRCCKKPTAPCTIKFSSLLCGIKPGRRSYDYVMTISSLTPQKRIVIPFKSHRVLNEWLVKPGAKLLQGATIRADGRIAYINIKIPNKLEKPPGAVLGVDVGVCKLLTDSNGQKYGQDCREVLADVRRKRPGSKGKQRAIKTRDQYFNRIVKQIPFHLISAIAVEKLTGIKTGKRKNRGKKFRKLLAPWTIRKVTSRIEFLAQLNRVRVVSVDPRNTSRTCPACRHCASENRKGENFKCINCGYRQDADEVGAFNILNKALETLGSVWSPSLQNPVGYETS